MHDARPARAFERLRWLLMCLALAAGSSACQKFEADAPTGAAGEPARLAPQISVRGSGALKPLPPIPAQDARKVTLGKKLFFEQRLSHDDTISCASCHPPSKGGADGLPVAIGIGGQQGPINTPTVLNAALNFVQFWDGRAATLEEQAAGPIHNPLEMGSNWNEVIAKLAADADYPRLFAAAFPARGITAATIAEAIAAYERSLLTPSRFDAWLQGDDAALSEQEQRGYRLFLDYGCASCHQGANVGGNLFQRFGVLGDYFAERGKPVTAADLGRYNVTGREEDRHVFKVPSLRNIALTAPYFHDASAATLQEAIRVMARYQLGRTLSDQDIEAIAAFLNSLTATALPSE
ncbi:MAG: cytochrome-c peroxidase [Rhodocyclaceae bacterium]